MQAMTTKLLGITEAADFLGVTSATLRRWDNEKIFRPYLRNSSGYRMYSNSQLKEWKEKRAKLLKTRGIYHGSK